MLRAFTILFSVFLPFFMSFASEPADSLLLSGNVRDAYTYDYLWDVRVELLSPADSSVLYSDTCRNRLLLRGENTQTRLRLNHVNSAPYIKYEMRVLPGDYLLRCTREGYTPTTVPLSIPSKRYGRSTKEWQAKDVTMLRAMQQQLGEATVRATKIMMVNKGDTVVFNADFFQLAQGNMLDQLVKMLPGMEIRQGGQVYYNGNLLSNLYVNGKDFFNGDPKVALQNLPAYMVRRIKVYEKEEETAYLEKNRDTLKPKMPNTLDVILKKEYSHGWMANAQVGGGPALGTEQPWDNSKYLAKLFGQYYRDNMRLSIIGNFNNISNTEVANDEGGWGSGWNPGNGELKLVFGAINYNLSSKKHNIDYVANLKGTKEVTDRERVNSSTTFLNGGDVYNRLRAADQEKMRHAVMSHTLKWRGSKAFVSLFTGVDYFGQSNTSYSQSAQFSADPNDRYRAASIDSLFDGPYSQRLHDILTNRLETTALERGNKWVQINRLDFYCNDPLLGNTFGLYAYGNYTKNGIDKYEHYDLRYRDATNDDFRNRYFDLGSDSFYGVLYSNYSFSNMMSPKLAKIFDASVNYQYVREQYRGHSWLYNLHLLENWTETPAAETAATPDTPPLGTLPSVTGWQEHCKDTNSYREDRKNDHHDLAVPIRLGEYRGKWGCIEIRPTLKAVHEYYADSRSQERANRHFATLAQQYSYSLYRSRQMEGDKQMSNGFGLSYTTKSQPPTISYLLDIRDDSNPLSVTLGNKDLHNSRFHSLYGSYRLDMPSTAALNVHFTYQTTKDAVAMGCTYDSQTGVYTYRPQNVDGNWNTNLEIYFNNPFGSGKQHRLSGQTSWNRNHSVDIMDEVPSVVDNHSVRQRLSLTSRYGKWATLTLAATANWQYATSERENFHTRNTWDISYGPHLQFNLPGNVNFSSEFTVYQRRGYDNRSMNDTELVWNAALNWDFDFRPSSYRQYETEEGFTQKVAGTGARPWSLRITAHDLLQQLSNTRHSINAQGITETWYKSIPSYIMLHISYRFAMSPKH